ncbi:hypothetical protein RUMTOR_00028 [[Ruminococcus] torques ATCC 27756]|uniref:Uncharacterized protein n=1 Tax=[Ruminococcus] torques ATCC 27756 TaxID=411460 RepID=A5KII3_9FIRM|nr:hypothetical protein RUMTOR_00028 [[Ruminococcus] torques ATCC 27756]
MEFTYSLNLLYIFYDIVFPETGITTHHFAKEILL